MRFQLEGWQLLPPGAQKLALVGAREMDEGAAAEFYVRTWAEPSLSVK